MNVPSFASAPPTLVDGAGQIVAERYRLEHPIARGAMGSIWRASHIELKAKVAIKFLDTAGRGDSELHDRFLQEARSAAAVRCAHVVQVFDYGKAGNVPFIVMELLEGETLEQRLAQRGGLTPSELDKIFRAMASGVSRAHAAGVVHRDLKPSNIFIAQEGANEVTKLIDFGIAKVDEARLGFTPRMGTRAGTVIGTPEYMSPEQLRSGADTDHGVDLWALGIVAFECLTGKLPFSGKTLTDIVVQICTEAPSPPSSLAPVPAGFDAWFAKAIHKDQSRRFSSAEEMAAALSAILLTQPEAAMVPAAKRVALRRVLERTRTRALAGLTWARSRRLPDLPALSAPRKAALAAAALACLAVGAVLSVRSSERAPAASAGPGLASAENEALHAGNGVGLLAPAPVDISVVQARLAPSEEAPNAATSSDIAESPLSGATREGTLGAVAANEAPAGAGAAPRAVAANGNAAGDGSSRVIDAKRAAPGAIATAAAGLATNGPAPTLSAERPRASPTDASRSAHAPSASAPRPPLASAARAPSPPVSKAVAIEPQPAKAARDPGAIATAAAPARAAPAPTRAAQGRPAPPEPAPAAKRPSSGGEALFADRL